MPTERYRRDYERLTAEQKARVEAIKARRSTPEARAANAKVVAALDAEHRATGTIAVKATGEDPPRQPPDAARRRGEKTLLATISQLLPRDDLGPSEKVVFLAILEDDGADSDSEAWGCTDSIGAIGTATGLSRSTVSRSLVRLAELGLVRIDAAKQYASGRVIVPLSNG